MPIKDTKQAYLLPSLVLLELCMMEVLHVWPLSSEEMVPHDDLAIFPGLSA
eukprot:CAMPEP_0202357342 /NCGR_PEP_ID=MMETSP1126-20121109/11404_1 /ASSEMBLY_ACC=CAM_ASM_000457 /TAXON_ID=3047 /ORGANISM="Dunaliella tertiolecta, Strain CCMP1320" /LENGTH=50 /DNA_ID=CAMNT_0048950197 /DNA_START=1066 /DNA_END=1218 /DNA_ORIENTATION=+